MDCRLRQARSLVKAASLPCGALSDRGLLSALKAPHVARAALGLWSSATSAICTEIFAGGDPHRACWCNVLQHTASNAAVPGPSWTLHPSSIPTHIYCPLIAVPVKVCHAAPQRGHPGPSTPAPFPQCLIARRVTRHSHGTKTEMAGTMYRTLSGSGFRGQGASPSLPHTFHFWFLHGHGQ